eukprot:6474547-Amphidinium_carterae.1
MEPAIRHSKGGSAQFAMACTSSVKWLGSFVACEAMAPIEPSSHGLPAKVAATHVELHGAHIVLIAQLTGDGCRRLILCGNVLNLTGDGPF